MGNMFPTPNLIFFCDLKPHTKFQNPRITPSVRKVMQAERREKNVVYSGHLVFIIYKILVIQI
jgi:hypothetical protein